jgi:hypothetical protein
MVENSDKWVHYRLHLLDAPFVQQKLEEQKQFWEDHGNGKIYLFYSNAFDKLKPKHDW